MNTITEPVAAVVRPADELEQLAVLINEEHAEAMKLFGRSLEKTRQCGMLLLEAKKRHKHGGWLKWLDANVEVGRSMASRYMRFAKLCMRASFDRPDPDEKLWKTLWDGLCGRHKGRHARMGDLAEDWASLREADDPLADADPSDPLVKWTRGVREISRMLNEYTADDANCPPVDYADHDAVVDRLRRLRITIEACEELQDALRDRRLLALQWEADRLDMTDPPPREYFEKACADEYRLRQRVNKCLEIICDALPRPAAAGDQEEANAAGAPA